ncbi:MAG: hypothetical protein Kow0089_02550 [Desulfobulbaceae bacterium]
MAPKADQVLNIAGILRPQSLFLVRKTLERIGPGKTLEIISDEKNAREILAGICPRKRYKLLEKKITGGLFHYIVLKN